MFAVRSLTIALAATLLCALAPDHAPAQDSIKPPVRGLISMGAYHFVGAGGQPVNTLKEIRAKPGILGGIVLVASWQQLQPVANGPLRSAVIDNFLDQIRVYNSHHPQKPLAVKLRVWNGFMAPNWAKNIGGAPIDVIEHLGAKNEKHRTLGRFWSPAYRAAYAKLQTMLAAKYDSEPLIREVSITQCMALTAEPFVVSTAQGVMNRLRAHGFTDEAYKDCLSNAVSDYSAWQQSRLVLSVNPLHLVNKPTAHNPTFTERVMRQCRKAIGVRCVLDNHDLTVETLVPNSLAPIYAAMTQLGPEIEFQTANETPANFAGTIKYGVSLGASGIELYQDFPGQGFTAIPDATLKQWASWIEANTGAGH